jgi:hypothetical protein
MSNKRLDQFAKQLQDRSAKLDSDRILVLYVICCALGALACGYVLYQGFERHGAVLHITPIQPPAILYDSVPDPITHYHQFK